MIEPILTDEQGRPIPRPEQEEFVALADYVRAAHEFDVRVRKSMRRKS